MRLTLRLPTTSRFRSLELGRLGQVGPHYVLLESYNDTMGMD